MKIYDVPDELPPPVVDYKHYDHNKVQADEDAHCKQLKEWLQKQGYNGEHTGKILQEPHADGYALYMLADGPKPCLIHLPYGDAWDSPNVGFLPKAEVLARIERQEKLAALFKQAKQD